MTTITIDTELNLPKTTFSNGIEAAYFLMWAQINEFDDDAIFSIQKNKKLQDKSTKIYTSNKTAYQDRNSKDYFTLEQMKNKYGIQNQNP